MTKGGKYSVVRPRDIFFWSLKNLKTCGNLKMGVPYVIRGFATSASLDEDN